jgi:hypothetical protein
MGRLVAIAALALISMSPQCQAQTKNHLLSGLSAVDLEIEELNPDSIECGITEGAIRASVMYPLSSAKIRVNATADAVLYVQVTSLYIKPEHICFANVRLEVYVIQNVTLEFSGEVRMSKIQVWHANSVAYSGRSRHAKYLSEILEDQSKKFVTDWNLDNKDESASGRLPTAAQSWPGSPSVPPPPRALRWTAHPRPRHLRRPRETLRLNRGR